MPGAGRRQVSDAVAVASEVVAAAAALALAGLPAEPQRREPIAAEEDRGHPDVPGIIPVLPAPGHLAGAVGRQGREAGPGPQGLDQAGDAARAQDHVVVEAHHPGRRPQPLPLVPRPGDRLPAVGVVRARRPDHAVHAEPDPVLGLDAAPHVVARRREVAAEEEQVDVHQGKSSPAASRSDRRAGYWPPTLQQWIGWMNQTSSALTAAVTAISLRCSTGADSAT